VSDMVDRIPAAAIGLTLAHHGLVVWGDDAEQAHARLVQVVARIEEYLATCRTRPPVAGIRAGSGSVARGAPPPGGAGAAGGARGVEHAG
jgi:Uncharacterized conserved protein